MADEEIPAFLRLKPVSEWGALQVANELVREYHARNETPPPLVSRAFDLLRAPRNGPTDRQLTVAILAYDSVLFEQPGRIGERIAAMRAALAAALQEVK